MGHCSPNVTVSQLENFVNCCVCSFLNGPFLAVPIVSFLEYPGVLSVGML